MDYQTDSDNTQCSGKASSQMALASMILGIVCVITSGCIYLAVVCGALGIIFAFLSNGGSEHIPAQAKAGIALSSFGLILVIAIYTAAFAFIMLQYGGIDEFIQEYMEYYNGGSLEGLYRNMGIN